MSRKQPLVLVLLGAGAVPSTKIIRTGIRDLLDSGKIEEVAIAWHGTASPLNTAFDAFEELDIPLYIYSETKVPREFSSLAEDVIISDDYLSDILSDSASRAKELSATCKLALLWDDEDEELMNQIVVAAAKKGITVLDLSNGLIPIMVEDDEEPAVQVEDLQPLVEETEVKEEPASFEIDEELETLLNDSEPDPTPFSREELAAMPFAAIKRMATAQGKMLPAKPTKLQVIDILLSDGEITTDKVLEMLDDTPPEPKVPLPVDTDKPIAVVVYNSGRTVAITLNDHQRDILSKLMLD